MPENRFGVLKTEIVLSVAVCDILDNRPDPIEVVRQKSLFHLTAEQIAEDPAEVLVAGVREERTAVGQHPDKEGEQPHRRNGLQLPAHPVELIEEPPRRAVLHLPGKSREKLAIIEASG